MNPYVEILSNYSRKNYYHLSITFDLEIETLTVGEQSFKIGLYTHDMAQDIKSSDEWNGLISSRKLVAADFWAPWCPYCLRLKPVFDSATNDYPDIKFVKVNVDQEQEISSRYGIRGVPVIKFFCEGKEVGEIVGYISKDALNDEIKRVSNSTQSCLATTSLVK